MTEPRLSKLGQAALRYAELGMRVFTCFPRSKKPMGLCDSVGEDGTFCNARLPARDKKTGETTCKSCGTVHSEKGGLYAATCDVETIKRWWTVEPQANIGVRCGDGLLVLDVDVPNVDEGKTDDGEATLQALQAEHGPLPTTPRQQTGAHKQEDGSTRRGWQYFFRADGEHKNSARKLGAGLDIRSDGGYVVAHPSVHPSGVKYEWEAETRPSVCPVADAPAWLIALVDAPREPQKLSEIASVPRPARPVAEEGVPKWADAALDGEYARAAAQTPGTRNQNLNTAAFKLGQLVGGGILTESVVKNTLTAAAEASGWAAEEGPASVEAVIASGLAAGIQKPRNGPSEREPYKPAPTRPELRVVSTEKPDPAVREKKPTPEAGKPVQRTGWTIEDWEDHVELKPETRIMQPKVVRNAQALLMYRAEFADLFVLDRRSQRVVLTRQPPWTANGHPYPRQMGDNDVTGFRTRAEMHGLRLGTSDIASAINFAAHEREIDPVLDRLKSFVWDGIDRLDNWLVDYMGADDNSFTRAVGAKWMIAAAERVVRPGCKFDYMLVLEGPQGVMKSTGLRAIAEALGPDAFSDRLSSLKNKDSMIELLGKVIVEVAELAAFKNEDSEGIKRFLSAQDDDLRLPWDKITSRLKRGCVFAGTVNPDGMGWLNDPTGGRRFWPVEVTRVDLERLRKDAPQLWAEARVRMEAGERTWLDDSALEEMAKEQAALRTSDDVWAERIDRCLIGKDEVRIPQILDDLGIEFSKRGSAEERRCANHLTKRGWKRRMKKVDGTNARYWRAPHKVDLLSPDPDSED